jgi:2EXR family
MPLTTFIFPKPPLKLQQNIWKHSLSEPRVVSLKGRGTFLEIPEGGKYFEEHYLIKASYHIPAALHCNSESREVATMKYTYCFEKKLKGKGIFFDLNSDMLYFTDQWALSAVRQMEVP